MISVKISLWRFKNNYILNAKTLQELELMNIEHEEILDVSWTNFYILS